MANSAFDAPRFNDEAAAFNYVESKLWPNGPVCPHCGNADAKRIRKMQGNATRLGLYNCNECRGQFTVRQGTILESSHLPLHLWLQIIHLMCASKKGISTNEIQRMLSCSMKTAWFLSHRIREAMATRELGPLGGEGGIVEIDETFTGRREGVEVRRGYAHKNVVLSLVERGGSVRSFHVDSTKKVDVLPVIKANVAKDSHVMTDEANQYAQLGDDFADHDAVDHGRGEYGYRDRKTGVVVTTNSAEGYFSVFKRGMIGVYQHCSEAHLHRYLAEFDFRHSNRAKIGIDDSARAERALQGVKGKRLTYETISH
ncbi:MAG: IS1595 family transposase [Roseiarcus sp.]